jgi:hypothetical protein
MDYAPFLDMPDTTHMFKTERGSTYAHTPEGQTIRNRSGEKHTDKSTGLQPKSGKTVYMDKNSTNSMAGWLQNADTATKLIPEFDADGKPTGKANVVLTEDYGPRKAGSVVASGNYKTRPEKGLHPIEIYRSESPVGDRAKGIHFGNAITEVLERAPAKPAGGGGGAGMVGVPLGRGTSQSGGGGGQPGNLNPMSLQRLMAAGGAIRMPKEYSQGGWKLI